ncbi:hypothetical protein ACJA88_014829 [Fusarium oxysporum]
MAQPSVHGENKLAVERRLSTLIQAMKIFHEQYDGVEGVVKAVRYIVDYVHTYLSQSVTETQHSSDSDLTLRVSLAMDWSLSSGRPSDAEDFTSYLGTLFHQPSRIGLPVSPVETDDGKQEEISQDEAHVDPTTAGEQTVSDSIRTKPSSFAGDIDAAESELFFGFDETFGTSVPSDCEQDYRADSDLESKINKFLENCGELNFNDLLIPT